MLNELEQKIRKAIPEKFFALTNQELKINL